MKPAILRLMILVGLAGGANAYAEDLPKTHFKVVGSNSPTVVSSHDEAPFWRKTVPEDSNGAITADYTPVDQMGIDDKTMLRLLKLGVMDFGSMDISKMAGDDPRFEGCDLAGLALDVDKARAACAAWAGVLDKQMQKNWNAKLLAFGANSPQVFWCRGPVSDLDDLKGKKIRVFNTSQRDLLQGIGATAVSMAFAEVVPALNNGVVDCAVTGSLSGNTGGWGEVTKTIYPLSMGWSVNALAVNLNTWNKLSPAVQQFMLTETKKFQDKMWATVREATEQAEDCNFGKPGCTMGKPIHMTPAPISSGDMARYKELVQGSVLKNWAKRCGVDCAKQWNNTVGETLELKAPTG